MLKRLLWLPIDLFRLTIDLWRLSADRIDSWGLKEQPCTFCRGGDSGRVPRPLPEGLLAYRNLWLIRWALPCVRSTRTPRTRRRLVSCFKEGGHLRISPLVPVCAIGLSLFWITLAILLLDHL